MNHFTPWHRNPLVVIDFETTGPDPSTARAVEIGCVLFVNGEPVKRFGSVLNPGVPVPQEATDVHGIKQSECDASPRFADIFPRIVEITECATPVAYNAPFDAAIMQREIRALDIVVKYDPRFPAFDPAFPWLDPLVMVKLWDRWEKGSGRHKLAASCARHGIAVETGLFHRAERDAESTGRLLWKLRENLGDLTISEVLRRQEKHRAEQEADYQRWKAEQDKKSA